MVSASVKLRRVGRCHLTFFWLEARLHIFQDAMRVAFSARGGNEILTGRTLFVGCPLGASTFCPAAGSLAGAATLAFFVCLDPTGFSPSESEDAFRLLELTARCCGMGEIMCGVKQDLNERRYGSGIDRALVMTTIAIQFTRRRVIDTRRNVETRKPLTRTSSGSAKRPSWPDSLYIEATQVSVYLCMLHLSHLSEFLCRLVTADIFPSI
jgi:hypothetical protein